MIEKKEICGLPVEYCPVCECNRVVSSDRTFCLTCGTVFTVYSLNNSNQISNRQQTEEKK